MNHALPRPPASEAFAGRTYDAPRDYARMNKQLRAVFDRMSDGQWRTLAELSDFVSGSDTSLSARLRDLRKSEYGSHIVESRPRSGGMAWEYKLTVNRGKS